MRFGTVPEQDLAANGHLQNIPQRNIGADTDILCGCQVVTAHVDIGIAIVSDRSCRAISIKRSQLRFRLDEKDNRDLFFTQDRNILVK